MEKVNRNTAEHYKWQKICDGWHLVQRNDFSVIAEQMPPHTAEDMHYHTQARQFFYMLSGTAIMKLSDREIVLDTDEGLEIAPGTIHQMTNSSDNEIQFLVMSVPKSHGDKIIV